MINQLETCKPKYSAQFVASLPSKKQKALVNNLSYDQLLALKYDWSFWSRKEQLPPPPGWFCWLLRSGRGAGKTRSGAEWIRMRAEKYPKYPIALIGQTKADVRDTMIELGDSSILKISPPWFMPVYESSKRRLTWPNGAVAIAYSGDEPDQLRGPQHGSAWIDELAKFKYPQDTWDNMELGLRLGSDPCCVVTTTPRPIKTIKELVADKSTVDVRTSTYANIANLSSRFIERVVKRYEGTRLGRQELHGEVLDDNPNALWKRDTLDEHRVASHPALHRIVVGVDPPAESGECGIVVVGVAKQGGVLHGYVIGDKSRKGSPAQWSKEVVSAYNLHKADRVIGEVNNGGQMVEHTIRSVDGGPKVSYKSVRASRGKYIRAEPIAGFYEQGRIHHVGTFSDLEDQLCEWEPGGKSPDRLDALVWALTELLLPGYNLQIGRLS